MRIQSIETHEQTPVNIAGTVGTKMRMLIGPADNASNLHMRHFHIEAGGYTPHHQHDYEHEIIVLRGAGVACSEGGDRPFHAGDVMSADMAKQMAEAEGIKVKEILTTEEIRPSADEEGRGLGGCMFIYKIAGAAAEKGMNLDNVYRIAEKVNKNMATIAVANWSSSMPAGPRDPTTSSIWCAATFVRWGRPIPCRGSSNWPPRALTWPPSVGRSFGTRSNAGCSAGR